MKDYAKKRLPQGAIKPSAHYASYGSSYRAHSAVPGWLILTFGLLMGMILSSILYWKLKAPISSKQETTALDTSAEQDKKSAQTQQVLAELEARPNRFDFYTVLPSMGNETTQTKEAPKEIATSQTRTAEIAAIQTRTAEIAIKEKSISKSVPHETLDIALTTSPQPDTSQKIDRPSDKKITSLAAAAPTTPASNASVSSQLYIVQVGSFSRLSPAESLKAQLALAGFETHIQTIRMGPRDTRYRVYVGPYISKEKALEKQHQLEQANQLHSLVVKFRV